MGVAAAGSVPSSSSSSSWVASCAISQAAAEHQHHHGQLTRQLLCSSGTQDMSERVSSDQVCQDCATRLLLGCMWHGLDRLCLNLVKSLTRSLPPLVPPCCAPMQLMPQEYEYSSAGEASFEGGGLPAVTEGAQVRVRVMGVRMDATELFCVCTMASEYLGVLENAGVA